MSQLSIDGANVAANAVCRSLDGGNLILMDAAGMTLAVMPFNGKAFQTARNGKAEANIIGIGEASSDGEASRFVARTSDNLEILSGSVGTADADLIIERTDLHRGSRIKVDYLVYDQLRA